VGTQTSQLRIHQEWYKETGKGLKNRPVGRNNEKRADQTELQIQLLSFILKSVPILMTIAQSFLKI
jgi:hypothetical protein